MDNNLSSGPSFNRLAHAQSTPAGVDGSGTSTSKTPPATPKKSGKMIGVRVQMLDDSITVFQVQVCTILRSFYLVVEVYTVVEFFVSQLAATRHRKLIMNFLRREDAYGLWWFVARWTGSGMVVARMEFN